MAVGQCVRVLAVAGWYILFQTKKSPINGSDDEDGEPHIELKHDPTC